MDPTQSLRDEQIAKAIAEEMKMQDFFKRILENSHVAIVVDHGGTVKFMNPAANRLFDCTLQDLVNQRISFSGPTEEPIELKIERPGKEPRVAEVRVAEAHLDGQSLYIATLFDVTEHVVLREGMRALSLTDELTGLYNRRGFVTLAQQQLKLANRTKRGMLVLFADLDKMKWINDAFGHREGDLALIETAGILKDSFRDSDIIARISGDEFAVVAMEATPDHAALLESRLGQKVDEHNAKGKRDYNLSISVGIAYYDPEKPCSIDELLNEADVLMYQNKWAKYNSQAERPQLPR